jgi:hypothetical protein
VDATLSRALGVYCHCGDQRECSAKKKEASFLRYTPKKYDRSKIRKGRQTLRPRRRIRPAVSFPICELLLITSLPLRYRFRRSGVGHYCECPILRYRDSRYFFASGGKCANIFCTPLSRFLVFLSALLESVSLAEPRQIKFLVLVSNRSTTKVPTL